MRRTALILGLLLLAGCAATSGDRSPFAGVYAGGSVSGAQTHAQGQP